jgi:hypothetical protein
LNSYKNESEKRSVFIENESKNPDHIAVSANIVSIDPIKGEMSVRFSFDPTGKLEKDGALSNDINLYVNSATGKQEYNFSKGKLMSPIDATFSLYNGLVTDYPFDKHESEMVLLTTAMEKAGGDSASAPKAGEKEKMEEVPVESVVNFEGSVTGYKIEAEQNPESSESYTILNIKIGRASSIKFFSVFVMVAMWALSLMVILLVLSVLLRARKVELAMFAFCSAMLFALPALRNIQPLVPPIGAYPDYIAFFWAESIAAMALITLVITWLVRPQK